MMIIAALILGLLIGSFLNVCIWRIPRGLSVVSPMRSFCTSCQRQLTWWENIPVISWCILKAKCRTCECNISGQYPLVETTSSIMAAATYLRYGLNPTSITIFILAEILIIITFIDLEFRIIPNVISYPGIITGLILGIFSQYTSIFSPPVTQGAFDSLIGMFLGGGFFYIISLVYYLLSGRIGLGMGDVKLMGMVGAVLGWRAIGPTIFVGSILGSVFGILVMLISKTGRKTEIAFGPWLSLGTLIYLFTDIPFLRF